MELLCYGTVGAFTSFQTLLRRPCENPVASNGQVLKVQEMKLLLIKEQLREAQETDKDAMSSTLIVEGEMMSFEIEELKTRLGEREIEVMCRATLSHRAVDGHGLVIAVRFEFLGEGPFAFESA